MASFLDLVFVERPFAERFANHEAKRKRHQACQRRGDGGSVCERNRGSGAEKRNGARDRIEEILGGNLQFPARAEREAGEALFTFTYDRNTSLTNSYRLTGGATPGIVVSIAPGTRQDFTTYLLRAVLPVTERGQLTVADYQNLYQNYYTPSSSAGTFHFAMSTLTHNDPRLGFTYRLNPDANLRFWNQFVAYTYDSGTTFNGNPASSRRTRTSHRAGTRGSNSRCAATRCGDGATRFRVRWNAHIRTTFRRVRMLPQRIRMGRTLAWCPV